MSLNKELNSEDNVEVTSKPSYAHTILDEDLGTLEKSVAGDGEIYKPTSPIGFDVLKNLKPDALPASGWGETVGAFYRHNDPLFNYAKTISNSFNTLSDLSEQNNGDFDPMPLLKKVSCEHVAKFSCKFNKR